MVKLATLIAGALVVFPAALTAAPSSDPGLAILQPGQQAPRAAEDRAVDLVSSLTAEALRTFQQSPDSRVELMHGLVERYADLGFVLRSSMPPDLLASLTNPERVVIGRAYLELAATDYARSFDGYSGERLDIVEVAGIGPGLVRVGAILHGPQLAEPMKLDWIVGGLETNRAGLRDIVIDGASTLAHQQQLTGALWEDVGRDKAAFMSRITASDPWGSME